jgi:hypothetical protein
MRACGENLMLRGQNTRFRGALIALAVALACSVLLALSNASWAVRALVFIPYFAAASLGMQALSKTCLGHAASGTRETEDGAEPIANPVDVARSRQTAKHIWVGSFAAASFATALLMLAR